MKVYDNMAYGLRNRGVDKQEIDNRVRAAAKALELTQLLDRKPSALSGGQRQRVAMGRAIVRSPKVFLFDEPLSNLDAKLRGQMRIEIKNLQRQLGVTAIYVTHDQVEAMTLADVLVVLNGGRAEQVGTPMEIYNRPATIFVAGFIGSPSMNILACSVAPGNKGLALPSGATVKPRDMVLPQEPGRRFVLGVRPEHLTQVTDGNGDFNITVDTIETLGADTLAHGRLEEGDGEIVARLPGDAGVREGDCLPLAIRPGLGHLFDAESGERVL
jgi:sn-glycerol 3-phosphate transport system ATP-binding protein